ncbi:predicted protein [Coccidioides posadasii str. Silveira]|uniref:Predicted protein n=1 Tax=Coccidioides posadasii (strain RMSCC 757 / Silveira) TaxID=443226 RepID=E9DCJ3_COCPS|nr:predicted protein [Coccidioides posadasii str. Silveira]
MAQLQPVTYEDIFFASALVAGRRFTLYWLVSVRSTTIIIIIVIIIINLSMQTLRANHRQRHGKPIEGLDDGKGTQRALLLGTLNIKLYGPGFQGANEVRLSPPEGKMAYRLWPQDMLFPSPNVNRLRVAKASRMCSVSQMRTNQGIPTFRRLDEQINRLLRHEDED